jgi:hypothetical protein
MFLRVLDAQSELVRLKFPPSSLAAVRACAPLVALARNLAAL